MESHGDYASLVGQLLALSASLEQLKSETDAIWTKFLMQAYGAPFPAWEYEVERHEQ